LSAQYFGYSYFNLHSLATTAAAETALCGMRWFCWVQVYAAAVTLKQDWNYSSTCIFAN
jgi:hypothetical protein